MCGEFHRDAWAGIARHCQALMAFPGRGARRAATTDWLAALPMALLALAGAAGERDERPLFFTSTMPGESSLVAGQTGDAGAK